MDRPTTNGGGRNRRQASSDAQSQSSLSGEGKIIDVASKINPAFLALSRLKSVEKDIEDERTQAYSGHKLNGAFSKPCRFKILNTRANLCGIELPLLCGLPFLDADDSMRLLHNVRNNWQ